MSLLKKLFKKNQRQKPEVQQINQDVNDSKENNSPTNLAFVLLDQAQLPNADALVQSFNNLHTSGKTITNASCQDKKSDNEIITIEFNDGTTAFVALMPMPIPNGEADEGAQFSISSLGTGWQLPPHKAHLLVTSTPGEEESHLDALNSFTALLAATTNAAASVGVYWGNSGATHDPDFFVSVASEESKTARVMLWSGISIANEPDGRLSLLSLGMRQLNLPDLLLVVSKQSESIAIETFFDLLSYSISYGKAIPDGDTVGRTVEEKLKVNYITSPINQEEEVWKVELP